MRWLTSVLFDAHAFLFGSDSVLPELGHGYDRNLISITFRFLFQEIIQSMPIVAGK